MAPHFVRARSAFKDIKIRSFYHTHTHTHTHTRTPPPPPSRTHTNNNTPACITGDGLVEWKERKRQFGMQTQTALEFRNTDSLWSSETQPLEFRNTDSLWSSETQTAFGVQKHRQPLELQREKTWTDVCIQVSWSHVHQAPHCRTLGAAASNANPRCPPKLSLHWPNVCFTAFGKTAKLHYRPKLYLSFQQNPTELWRQWPNICFTRVPSKTQQSSDGSDLTLALPEFPAKPNRALTVT